jgi:hypothetical protein
MTDEDRTAARLKGENCLIKFKDGEELLIHVADLDHDDDTCSEWFMDMEKFINGVTDAVEYCPLPGFAMTSGSIKYVRKI